ncbi:MAG: hypothetical protein JWM74_1073 [Myxococcaceae bacterium]|nr:hypothetical protein [Myxococcaceae bacterium]
MGIRRAVSLVALAMGFAVACSLTTSLDGLTGGPDAPALDGGTDGAGPDGLTPADALPAEAAADAGDAAVSTVPVALAVSPSLFAAGSAQETHLHYAKSSALWVLFYLDADAAKLKTRVSSDFVTWTDDASLTLPSPHPGDGRSFAVTYDDLAGRDVFHVSYAVKASPSDRRHHHARGVMTAGKMVFEPAVGLSRVTSNDNNLEPDGPAVLTVQGGTVVDMSGWLSPDGGTDRTGNVMAWLSTDSELGGTWSPSFGGPIEVFVVPIICNARALVRIGAGALAVWEGADAEPNPSGLTFARFNGTTWSSSSTVDPTKATMDVNDWGLARLDDSHIHAVRFAGGLFRDRVYDGAGWTDGPTMPSATHLTGEGVVALADAGTLRVFMLDSTGAILTTSLTAGAWSAWAPFVAAASGRSGLSGYAGVGGAALVWVDKSKADATIAGVRVR